MIIGIDFDGTCTTHDFPNIGRDIGAVPILKKLVKKGHKLILFTMRSDRRYDGSTGDTNINNVVGPFLNEAIEWFTKNDITLWAVQANPTQHKWTSSPKAYCQLYIDDAALGIPLIFNTEMSNKPYVDWEEVEFLLEDMNLI